VNGVINIGYTTDSNYPVWAPMSNTLYDRYIKGDATPKIRDQLVYQLLYILYTVRNNLVHAGKQPDDANDITVVDKATPLLYFIVSSFMAETS